MYSPVIALRLYVTGIFELQRTRNFVDLLKTCVVISPFSLTNSVSRNFVGITSNGVLFFHYKNLFLQAAFLHHYIPTSFSTSLYTDIRIIDRAFIKYRFGKDYDI